MIAALGCGIGVEDFDIEKLRYHRVIIMTDADVDGSHIRTLLLTFFYRQMPMLIDRGHVFIAQPPLFRAKRGRAETYIKDEHELEMFLIRRAIESRVVRLADGTEMSGEALELRLQGMMTYQRLLQVATRRGSPADVVATLLSMDARDKGFFDERDRLDQIAERMTKPNRTVTVQRDEEHNTFSLAIDDRSLGYPQLNSIGVAFVATAEYRTLLAAYRNIQDVSFPVTVGAADVHEEIEADERPEAVAAEAPVGRGRKEPAVTFADVNSFVDYFIAAGKKGIAVNRYKGLGEMNADTLWMTTMDPEHRTLLQVRAEDHTEADQMFTTLMGDQVEPRRRFIEENALDVRNLDV